MSLAAIWKLLTSPIGKGLLAGVAVLIAVVVLIEKGKSMERAKQELAVAAARKKADELSAKLEAKQREADAVRAEKVSKYAAQIRTTPSDPNCPADAGDRAASRSVRDLLGNPKTK